MKITSMGYSGFVVETDKFNFIFDYYTGEIPDLSPRKETFVFVTSSRYDHMNPEVFELAGTMKKVRYILSSDIPKSVPEKYGIKNCIFVEPGKRLQLETGRGRVKIRALPSTGAGVALLVITKNETLFHAGELNLWLWDGMSEREVYDLTKAYKEYTSILRKYIIDVAFLTLDNRQKQYAFLNIDYLMQHFKIKNCIPMHYCGSSKICDVLKDADMSIDYRDRLIKLKPFRYVTL